MNINRNNYETFFLLYVDNELSAAERIAVEKFVQENTDLKKELELFIETTLSIENISFAAKEILLKNEITTSLQDDLLSHIDNEVSVESKILIEERIATDDLVHEEWKVLQQTKLDPSEKIVFADKKLLYRHERDNVVTLRFWKIAIAALFIGAGLFFGVKMLKKEKQAEPNATVSNNGVKRGPANEAVRMQPLPTGTKNINESPVLNNNSSVNSNNDNSVKQDNLVKNQSKQNVITPGKKDDQLSKRDITPGEQLVNKETLQKETNHLPKPYFENINNNKSNQITPPIVEYKKKETIENDVLNNLATVTPVQRPKEIIPTENNTLTELPNSYAKNAAYNELDEKNNNRVLYMDEEKVNKSKLSGFFRKVKRVLVRNTKIKTGDGLRIGGFEIASK